MALYINAFKHLGNLSTKLFFFSRRCRCFRSQFSNGTLDEFVSREAQNNH